VRGLNRHWRRILDGPTAALARGRVWSREAREASEEWATATGRTNVDKGDEPNRDGRWLLAIESLSRRSNDSGEHLAPRGATAFVAELFDGERD